MFTLSHLKVDKCPQWSFLVIVKRGIKIKDFDHPLTNMKLDFLYF